MSRKPNPGKPLIWRPKGASDTIDGSNSFPGAMAQLSNLIPSPYTQMAFVPRPAALSATTFSGFSTPAQVEALLVVGNIAYGMIASAAFSGKSQPFAYNILTNAFLTITGQASTNLPTSTSTSGDWTPPTMAQVGSRIVVTHPGFSGGSSPFFGWLDISGFTSNSLTGNTHTTKTVDSLSANPLTSGWEPGMTISSSAGDIPANTTIVSLTATSVTLSAAATGSNSGVTLTVTGGTATSPQWAAGNTNTNALAAVPVAVANFNARAYYAVPGSGVMFSDSGNATQITNASQGLNAQNGLNVTAFGGLPISQLIGGALQSLIAFQGDANILQITGDPATSNLALNTIGVGVGCLAPNTICNTTQGLAFVAPDGLRFITLTGQVTDPVGANGTGINVPFVSALTPTRMCAAFNQNVLRISCQNGSVSGQPVQEWWLDFSLKIWTGPHTFPAALIQPYQAASGANTGHGFILAANGINAQLWTSQVNVSSSSVYTENSVALAWTYQTSLLPDNQTLQMSAIVQSDIAVQLPGTQSISVLATDQSGATLNQVTLTGSGAAPVWGTPVWGGFLWTATQTTFIQKRIPWTVPLVFKQLQVQFSGSSQPNFTIGNLYNQVEALGYNLAP